MVSVTQNHLTPGKRQLPAPSSIDRMGSTLGLRASLDILERDITHAPTGSRTTLQTLIPQPLM